MTLTLIGIENKQTREEARLRNADMMVSGRRSGQQRNEQIPSVRGAKSRE